jgi:nucleoside-diphosphate-sugar epimerase
LDGGYGRRMRVVVLGASGNVGTAVLEALHDKPGVTEIVAVARRLPQAAGQHDAGAKISWLAADIATDDLDPALAGADVVVSLAWLFQPTHRPDVTWANNVLGTNRVLEAVARCGAGAFVYSSSVGAYSPRTTEEPVDESWATHGASSAAYAREKAYVERLVDLFEERVPSCRVVRLRPAFVFHRRAAAQQRRLFGGPFVPGSLVRPELVPMLPVPRGLLLQTVHADDVGQAFASAVVMPVRGAFNVCADEVLHAADLAALFDARVATVPARLARSAVSLAWRAHAVPAAPELLDALLSVPMMSNARAKTELGWSPRMGAADALAEFIAGLRAGAGHPTPPLDPDSGGPLRLREVGSGVGNRP